MVQLSHPYVTSGKTIVLTRQTFFGKVMSLLLNMLSRFVITLLSRSKHVNFMTIVTICSDFGAQEDKVWHCFHCFPIYLPWNDGTGCHDLHFLAEEKRPCTWNSEQYRHFYKDVLTFISIAYLYWGKLCSWDIEKIEFHTE